MKVAIIGGYGKMGRWFARFLAQDGKEVIIAGRNEKKLLEARQHLGEVEIASNIEAVKRADVIIISVPISNFDIAVAEISPYVNPLHIVLDVTSIKSMPVETMHKHIKTGRILGTHPMFGPGAKSLKNQNVVLTPTTDDERCLAQKVKEYLESKEARVTLMNPQEHDELIAVVLGLAHFIGVVSADALLSLDKLQQLNTVAGTTYKVLLTLVRGVVSRDPEFYATLQMSLPNMPDIEELFLTRTRTWADLVKRKDKQEFIQRMNTLKEKLEKEEPDFADAYETMYKLVEEI